MSACALKGLCPKICHDLDRHLEAVGGNIVDAKIFRVPLNHSGKVGDMFWYETKKSIKNIGVALNINKLVFLLGRTLFRASWDFDHL